MTIAQIIVAYAVCWWLVLFMVLPHQADAEKNPQTGNAPSAPAKPQLKKKCIWTTFIAIVPTLLVYFAAENAKAADDDILHASSKGCHKSANVTPSAAVATKEGFGTGDKQVAPADLAGGSTAYKGDINIPLYLPSQKYTDPSKHNVDLSQSFIDAGKLTVTPDGKSLLNGKPIQDNGVNSDECK